MLVLMPTEVQNVLNATGNSSVLYWNTVYMVLQIIAKHSFVVYLTVLTVYFETS